MGPISTGLGEIYLWTVEAEEGARKADGTAYTPTDLREIQDWVVRPQLRNVPGVTEINSIGGYAKEYQVAPSPEKLMAHGLTLADLVGLMLPRGWFPPVVPGTKFVTLGGMVASGLAGPARASVGGVRDFVLGVHVFDHLVDHIVCRHVRYLRVLLEQRLPHGQLSHRLVCVLMRHYRV